MLKSIGEYEDSVIDLNQLINDLYNTLENLTSTPTEWEEEFRSEWWTLEQVYAVALDRQDFNFSVETENMIMDSVNRMKSLLNERSSGES